MATAPRRRILRRIYNDRWCEQKVSFNSAALEFIVLGFEAELACAGRHHGLSQRCLARVLALAQEGWMFEATANNLCVLVALRKGKGGIE